MANYAEYFERTGYKPKYQIGDRVWGKYNGIPFIGTVGNDRLISHLVGPEITIQLDLPMQIENEFRSIIIAKHKDIKRLKDYDAEETSGVRRKAT